jgi:hypothetical protein
MILDPRNIFCFGVCLFLPERSEFSLNLYSRNNPYAGFVEFTPQLSIKGNSFGVLVSISAFNGRSRLLGDRDWNPYREYSLEVVDWKEEPIISKYPIFEALQYRAFGWLNGGFIKVKVGRDYLKIGKPLRYPLFFSGWGYPLDWFYLAEGGFEGLRGYSGFARVPSKYENKRLAFQRLEWGFWNIKLGISEMVVYTREDTWKYANPFVLYYVVQRRESDNDDNLFLHLDLSLNFKNLEIFGEFMGDDPSVFHGEGQAPLMGFTGGIRWEGENFFNLEASIVLPFTYAHFTRKNNFDALGLPLSNFLGQDYISIYAYYSKGSLFSDIEYILHGNTPFGLAFENSGLPPVAEFPRKPREGWWRVGFGSEGKELRFRSVNLKSAFRLGVDLINGNVSPSWSFLWFLSWVRKI